MLIFSNFLVMYYTVLSFYLLPSHHHHHHHQSLFIHKIVSFYMVFLGIMFKTRLKYSKELLTIMLKIQKLIL